MPIFTALATAALTGAFWTTATGVFLISVFSKVATSALVNLILEPNRTKNNKNKKQAFGIQGKLQSGEENPRGAPLGKCMTAGSLVYANTWGGTTSIPNAYLVQVICLSDLPIKGLSRVMVNGAWVTLAASPDPDLGYGVTDFMIGSAYYMWVKFYDGTQTTADSYLTSKFSADPDYPYDTGRKGIGCAYAIVTTRYSETLFQSIPELKFEVQSIKLYDPSKDTSVGGSGAQRWATPSTWGGDGDDLPMVQAYNIMRGMSYSGTWVYGFQGVSQAQLPDDVWINQINVCRSTVETGPSTSEYRYRAGGYLTFDTECGKVLEALMASCAGRISDCGGIYKPMAGAYNAAIASFTDDDIISTEEGTFNPVKQLADLINGVIATYPDPATGYEMKAATPYYRTDLEANDQNRRLLASVSFANVPYALQVQRLQKLIVEEVRRTRRHQITLPPSFWKLEPNDSITWTSTRNGYSSKLFRVNAVVDQPDSSVVVDIVEANSTDYDYTYTDYVTPTYPVANPRAAKAHWIRNEKIRATDWLAVDDAWSRLTMSQQIRAQAYRDAVRDAILQAGWPSSVTWPDDLPDFQPICDPMNRLYEVRANAPNLNPTLIVTVRNTTGTFINSRGYYDTAAVDTARVTYDPVTREIEGILCEGPATNLCRRSAELATSPWSDTRATATNGVTKCPDGTVSGCKLVADTSTGTHFLSQSITGTAGVKHWAKFHIKAAEYHTVRFLAQSTGMADTALWFNATTGAVTNLDNAPDVWVKQHRDGWWEVNWSYVTVSSETSTVSVRLTSGGSTTFTGTGSSGVYLWGADVRVGESPGFYIPTTSTTVKRGKDYHVTYLFAAFFDPDNFSVYLEAEWFGGASLDAGNRPALGIDVGSENNQIRILNRSGKPNGVQIEVGSTTVIGMDGTGDGTAKTLQRFAASIATNDVRFSTDGSTVQNTSGVALPTFSSVPSAWVGGDVSEKSLNGIIRQVRFFNLIEADAKLMAMCR